MGKNKHRFFLINLYVFIFIFGLPYTGLSQCVPDTANCEDIGDPGEICPDSLPSGMQGVPYEEVITIISPDTVTKGAISTSLVKIRLDTVLNLPPGIVYESEYREFFPDSVYCILLSGTPTDTGTYYLGITITPFIDILGSIVSLDPVTDDTSIFIRIEPPSLSELTENNGFKLLAGYPNPFQISTRIGYTLSTSGETEIMVYNMLGCIVYHEKMMGSSGKNYFKFTGEDLPSGIYLYSVIWDKNSLNAKLVKSR